MSGDWTTCSVCGIIHGMPAYYHAKRKEDGKTFYCPNGHAQIYTVTDKQRLEAEVSRLKQRIAEKDDEAQPICAKDFPFELTCSFLLTPDKPGLPLFGGTRG